MQRVVLGALFLIFLATIVLAIATARYGFTPQSQTPRIEAGKDVLPLDDKPAEFSWRQVPKWLFLHVAIIGSLQSLSVLIAALMARRRPFETTRIPVIQFLIEIPMYLGLFGTLLGVCLTQFITGSLVAPLAYLTTMSGILLHVLGKLTVLLPLQSASIRDED